MNTINTNLTIRDNDTTARLSKRSKVVDTRKDWDARIRAIIDTEGEPTKEFSDMNVAQNDGLDDVPWEGDVTL